ncbi:hypothetical protein ACT18_04080 [Mycolicibacter kumamotonensis]|uniref:Uncharacterized protein n=1 Tax=Mycolicibacter kumamotonensis TaxID=354243 RepID=A0A1B8SJW5_9MYCO|nr:hypothetical protein ACT18_04080 [Mycolicibacter kumamotonensis]
MESAAPPAASVAPPAASAAVPAAASAAPPAASAAPPAESAPRADSPLNASPGSSNAAASKSVGTLKSPNGVTRVSVMVFAAPSVPGISV